MSLYPLPSQVLQITLEALSLTSSLFKVTTDPLLASYKHPEPLHIGHTIGSIGI
jgi:hypothetical protein